MCLPVHLFRCSSSRRGCPLRQGRLLRYGQSGAEGKFFVVVLFFCHDLLLRPCTCSSLLTNAAIAPYGAQAMAVAVAAAIVAVVIRYVAVAVVLDVAEATVLAMATKVSLFDY